MSEPDESRPSGIDEDDDDEIASTPFDNPFFLPVILLGFCAWFAYDGWFNPEMEWLKFNRVGAGVTLVLGVWFTAKAIRERREDSPAD